MCAAVNFRSGGGGALHNNITVAINIEYILQWWLKSYFVYEGTDVLYNMGGYDLT